MSSLVPRSQTNISNEPINLPVPNDASNELEMIWEREVIPDVEGAKKMARSLVWLGPIPSRFRCLIWKSAIGNQLHITPELFDIFLSHARSAHSTARHTLQSEVEDATSTPVRYGQEATLDLIPIDLPRSVGRVESYESISAVLEAYTYYRPDVGYVQGMSYIARVFAEVGMTEFDMFLCLANVLHAPCLRTFYSMDVELIQPYILLHNELMHEFIPDIANHLECIGLSADIYIYEWILTLYGHVIPKPSVYRIWDGLFLRGEKHLFIVSVGLLKALSPHILDQPFDEVAVLLTRGSAIAKHVDEGSLFTEIQSIRLTSKRYHSLLKACQIRSAKSKARKSSVIAGS